MPCFGRIPKFKSWFSKAKFSTSKLRKCLSKESPSYAKREKLLKRQRKAQMKFYKTLRKQQIKREKQLRSLKKAACAGAQGPPPAHNPSPFKSSPITSPPKVQKKCKKKLRNLQRRRVKLLGSLKKVASRLTPPARNPSPCNSSPSHSPRYPCNPPPTPHPSSKKPPPCIPHIDLSCRSSSACSCSDHKQCLARAMRKHGFCNSCWPKVACLSSSGPLKVKWSLSTCAQCDFVLEPPKLSTTTLQRQTPCLGLDKLIKEERDNQEWNVAFQKALVKRLEASERRITLDDYLDDDDDDDGDGPRTRKARKKKNKKEAETVTEKPKVKAKKVVAKLPEAEEVFKEKKCPCSTKIKSEERKRKAFVRIMEREQIRFEKRSLRAQRKYERDRQKAYKKCEYTQLAMEKGYFKRNKDGAVDKAEETFSVFIHMDPAQCGCKGKAARAIKFKKCFFKCCVWLYILGFIVFFVTAYFLTKI